VAVLWGLVAARKHASAVPQFEGGPDRGRDEPLGATHVEHLGPAAEHSGQHVRVTQQPPQDAGRQRLFTADQPAGQQPGVRGGLRQRVVGEGDDDAGPVAAVGRGECLLAVAVHHRDERVSPAHRRRDQL